MLVPEWRAKWLAERRCFNKLKGNDGVRIGAHASCSSNGGCVFTAKFSSNANIMAAIGNMAIPNFSDGFIECRY